MPQIEAEVEVYPLPDFTQAIIGGSLGGLALLVLITTVLYKVNNCRNTLSSVCYLRSPSCVFDIFPLNSQVGFFKSKYKQMLDDTEGEAGNPEAGDQPSPEQM